jgi:hypothetical protein
MFCVSEAEAAAIRAIFHERGEFSAAVACSVSLMPGNSRRSSHAPRDMR